MRNGFMFNTARTMAMASLLTAIGLPIIGPGAVRAAPAPDERDTGLVAPGPASIYDPLDAMFDFWLDAWGLDYVPGESSMLLSELFGADV